MVRWSAMVLAAALVAGCAGASGPAGGAGSRTVTHELGRVEVPVRLRNVVAVDEIAGLAALSHGIVPSVVYTAAGDRSARAVLAAAGVELADVEVAMLPPLEQLLAHDPDLVVGAGSEGALAVRYADVAQAAPVVILPITGEWREVTARVGELLGDPAGAARQVSAIEERLRAAAGPAGGRVLSLLGNSFGTTTFTMPRNSPISALIAEAGFTRPAPQGRTVDGYSIVLSPEQLAEHDGRRCRRGLRTH